MSGLKKILSPSILSADFKKLGEELETIDKAGAEYVHVDVMDGLFVKSISFGMPVIKSARSATDKVFDVHLMIEEPIRYIEDFVKAGADIITVHVEACKDVVATLEKIKECGVKAAITLNPPTPVSAIEPYLDKVDMVLVMSVNPGFGGQKFIPESLDKVKEIRTLLDAKGLDTDIEIDESAVESFDVESMQKMKATDAMSSTLATNRNIESLMGQMDETFSQRLLRLIDERGMTDSEAYNKAYVDRRHFSKIRKDVNYTPNKKTVLAFAIALELSIDEAKDLLNSAGFAFSRSSKTDIIVAYFLQNKIYDMFEINEILDAYGQPIFE